MQSGSSGLTDAEFLDALTGCSYAIDEFRHLDHLRLGWILLSKMDAASASDEAAGIIRRLGLHHGKGHAFHATITRGWMRLLASQEASSFEEFVARHGARFTANLLGEFWRSETLNSRRARMEWVEPDIQPLPPIRNKQEE